MAAIGMHSVLRDQVCRIQRGMIFISDNFLRGFFQTPKLQTHHKCIDSASLSFRPVTARGLCSARVTYDLFGSIAFRRIPYKSNVFQIPAASIMSRNFTSGTVYRTKSSAEDTGAAKDENIGVESKEPTANTPISQRQKLAKVFAEYGTTAVVFHTCISLTSLGLCYMIVSSGVDMVSILAKVGLASDGLQGKLTSGASTFVVAYACHKVFMPVRIFMTVTCTPLVVQRLRAIGFLRTPPKKVDT